jgi:hypothetical protein
VNTPTRDIAVIRAHLPYIDRRALSQAWFSALRLASDGRAPAREPQRVPPSIPSLGRRSAAPACAATPRAQPEALARGRDAAPQKTAGMSPGDATARRRFLEGAVAASGSRARAGTGARAAFTVTLANARVRLVVRGEGDRLHVVALCSSRHVETVTRALALAAFSLRHRGPIATSVHATGYAS